MPPLLLLALALLTASPSRHLAEVVAERARGLREAGAPVVIGIAGEGAPELVQRVREELDPGEAQVTALEGDPAVAMALLLGEPPACGLIVRIVDERSVGLRPLGACGEASPAVASSPEPAAPVAAEAGSEPAEASPTATTLPPWQRPPRFLLGGIVYQGVHDVPVECTVAGGRVPIKYDGCIGREWGTWGGAGSLGYVFRRGWGTLDGTPRLQPEVRFQLGLIVDVESAFPILQARVGGRYRATRASYLGATADVGILPGVSAYAGLAYDFMFVEAGAQLVGWAGPGVHLAAGFWLP